LADPIEIHTKDNLQYLYTHFLHSTMFQMLMITGMSISASPRVSIQGKMPEKCCERRRKMCLFVHAHTSIL